MARQGRNLRAVALVACLFALDSTGFRAPSAAEPADEPAPPPAASVATAPFYRADPSGEAETERAVEVLVLDRSGDPAAGATVLAVGAGMWPARKVVTGDDGRVRIGGLDRGVYDFKAQRGDDVSVSHATVILNEPATEKLELSLVKGKKVKVLVVDGETLKAAPIASASIVLAEGGLSPFPLEAVTNDEGVALIGPVTPSLATLSARAEGFVPRTGVVLEASADDAEIALVRGGFLLGEVVDGRDRAIEGVKIEVIGTDLSGAPIAETSETLLFREAHFAFALEGPRPLLPSGELGIMPGRVPDIPRGPSVMASGGNFTVPMPASRDGEGPKPWMTDDAGTFRASPVSPGRLRVIARHPDFVETISPTVRLRPGEERRVKLVMRAGGTLIGKVVNEDDEPVVSARVEIADQRGTLSETRLTDEDGNFTLKAAPQKLSLTIFRPGSLDLTAYREELTMKEGEQKELEIKLPKVRESVRIRVKDEDDNPLSNAQVTVASLSPKAYLRRTRFTEESGEAEFADAEGLPLQIEVSLPGRAPLTLELDAAPAEIAIELARGVTVVGRVTTRRGFDPLDKAEVSLHMKGATLRARTDGEGQFQLDDVSEGPARMTFSREGHVSTEREVTIQRPRHNEPFEIEEVDLPEAGSVEGEVVDARGNPVAGARIAQGKVPVYLPGGRAQSGLATSDRHGHFELGNLPEGELLLEAYSAEEGRGQAKVEVRAGRVTDRVRIVLAAHESSAGESDNHDLATGGVAVTLGERDVTGGVHVIVIQVAQGSEAERAGLLEGDRIVTIDEKAVTSMQEARAKLSGPLGEDVILRIEREGREHRLRFSRERVEK